MFPSFRRLNVSALAIGAIAICLCSLIPMPLRYLVVNIPVVTITVGLLVFLLPGGIVGAIAPVAPVVHGAIVGVIGAAFITFCHFEFRWDAWSSAMPYEMFGAFAVTGIVLCGLSALAVRAIIRWRQPSINRPERSRV
jgi:hypothetical protein